MAQCDFLDWKWSSSYYCRKADKSLDQNTVNTYCDNSLRYRDCPIYCGTGSSGCYLTTACVDAKNLSDDCKELTVLREFRDGYMSNRLGGLEDVQAYYRTAPHIVARINCEKNKDEIYEKIYDKVIQPCVEMIENGDNEDAYELYKKMVKYFEKRYM